MDDPTRGSSTSVEWEARPERPHSSEDDSPPVDVLFDVLANEDRRIVLTHVFESDASVGISELARHVYDSRTGGPTPGSSPVPEQVERRLRHNHVPKLVGADLVEFEGRTDRIAATELCRSVVPFLELAADYQRSGRVE